MPVIRDTLAAAAQFDGTAGSGLITFPVGSASGPDVNNSDQNAAILILLALNIDNDADVADGSIYLRPVIGSQGPSDIIQIEKWDTGQNGFTLPCKLPVPQNYELVLFTAALPDEATFTCWWKVGEP